MTLPDGIEETIDSDGAIVKPWPGSRWFWRYSAQSKGYTGNSNLVLVTFACKVNDDCVLERKTITVEVESFYDNDVDPMTYTIEPVVVSIEAKPVAVTGVTIDETLSLKTGESKTPSYTVNPADATNKAVSFKSDNTAIATVNETTGKVTGVKEGTATITITTADGNFTDTCVVTVACSHANKTSVPEKASDCKTQGWDAYIKCDDCGQLFKADGTTEILQIPFRQLFSEHTGGTATCTAKAVCTVCNQPYGDFAAHSYTAANKKTEALKTEGNCREYAVYYYSCSACGKVEGSDSHTFRGDKVPGTHIGGTVLINQSEANHKAQTDGYTGDTKCLGCGEIIGRGQTIPAGAHTPADTWSADGEYHWKECSVTGCGTVIESSKAAHTPDRDAATETDPVKCSVCGYEMEAQLSHTHVFDKKIAEDQYLASKASCTEPARYYKSCECGEKGSDTFASGAALGHTEGSEWKHDKTNHWKECVCGEKLNVTAHTDADANGKCDVCSNKLNAPDVPQAGDRSIMWLCAILMLISGVGIVAIIFRKKKMVR